MKLRIVFSIMLVFLGGFTIAFRSTSVNKQQISGTTSSKIWPALSEKAQKAKEQGKRKVIFRAPIPMSRYVESLSDTLKSHRVIVAQPVAQKSYPQNNMDIITWHKFRIVEDLSSLKSSQESDSNDSEALPEELDGALLPVEENEVLIWQAGGILEIDGVTLVQESAYFPILSIYQRYLFFISKDSPKKIGELGMGPFGTFAISEDNFLNPIARQLTPISRDINRYYSNSLDRLRMGLRNRNLSN